MGGHDEASWFETRRCATLLTMRRQTQFPYAIAPRCPGRSAASLSPRDEHADRSGRRLGVLLPIGRRRAEQGLVVLLDLGICGQERRGDRRDQTDVALSLGRRERDDLAAVLLPDLL